MIPEVLFIVVAPLILAAVIAGIVYAAKKEKERREALAALATELGFRFDPSSDSHHDDEYAHFEIFRKGHSRSAYNTLSGQIEIDGRTYPTKAGDFTYKVTSSNGKTTTTSTYRFSYAILHLPFQGVPDLLIRKEGIFDKIASVIGFDDIDFESAEFSRRFLVKGPDKRFAYDIVHPRMMEFLMQSTPPMIDIERSRVCLMVGERVWPVHEFRRVIRWAEAFFELWPEHVIADLTSRHGARR
jgi:hypothetical protein